MTDDEIRVTRIRPVASPHRGPIGGDPLAGIREMVDSVFGRGGGGGRGGNGGGVQHGGGPQARSILAAAAALLVVWGVLSSFFTVNVSEEGVVTRFGGYDRTVPPGAHGKLPFGIERVIKVQSKRVLQEEFGFRTRGDTAGSDTPTQYDKDAFASESVMLTGDLNVADVEWIVQFRIADPWKYLFHARDVRRNVRDVSMSIMRRVVGDRLVGDVLTTGRIEIAEDARKLTQEVLDRYDMGVHVERIILQGANPPEKVKPAFHDVNAAKQEQEQTINLAESEYNKVIPEARGKAEKLVADAEAYAIDVENRARGDASSFAAVLRAYKSSPDVTRRRLYVDAMEEVLAGADHVTIVDANIKTLLPLLGAPTSPLPTPTTK